MIKRKTKFLTNNNGSVMLFSILLMTLFFVIISSLVVLTIGEIRQATQVEESSSAYMAAEAGFERAQNYAKNDTPISRPDQPLRGGTTPPPPTYTFEVVKAGAGKTYDAPGRKCDNTVTDTTNPDYKGGANLYYCFYSRGKSSTTVRKLDGITKIRRVEQGSIINFSTYTPPPSTRPDTTTAWPWTNSSNRSLLVITPADARKDYFTLTGEIRIQNMVDTENHYFGLYGSGSGSGIGIKVYQEGVVRKITLTGATIGSSTILDTATIIQDPISPLTDNVRFTLTYRRAATSASDHTITLQVNNSTDNTCLGIKTYKFTENILQTTPFYAFFLSGGPTFNQQPYEEDSTTGFTYLSIKNSPSSGKISLSSFIFNTSGTVAP